MEAAILIGFIIGILRGLKMTQRDFTEADAAEAIRAAKQVYGVNEAAILEKILRLETAHFKSEQFKKTGSGGMEIGAGKKSFPYGWTSPLSLWNSNPNLKPIGTLTTPENKTGIVKTFIIFPSVKAAAFTMAEVLKRRGWNAGSWFSTNPVLQENYNRSINKIKARF